VVDNKDAITLKNNIECFVRVLNIFTLFQAALVFSVGLSKGLDPFDNSVYGLVVIMVGNVPQVLPSTVMACLFVVVDQLGEHNVFVKKLDIIETLGSCTLICTDKTGTLICSHLLRGNRRFLFLLAKIVLVMFLEMQRFFC
jgi:Ca2+-transporting ATPase